MACQCGTQEEIEKLYRAYGVKIREKRNSEKLLDRITYYFYAFMFCVCCIVVVPIIFVVVLAMLFWREGGTINIQHFNIMRLFATKKGECKL